MAPSATEVEATTAIPIHPSKQAATSAKPWVKATGALDQHEHIEITPVIGREYPHVNLVSLLQAPNSEELLRELSLISNVSPFSPPTQSLLIPSSLPTRSSLLPLPKQPHRRPAKRTHPKTRSRLRKTLLFRPAHPSHPEFRARRLSCQ